MPNLSLVMHLLILLSKSHIFLVSDTCCELCGFDFENRKALASHARAHLRQLGIVEWKSDGATSPIELLSELIRRDPVKVAAITQRYRTGDLYIKRVSCKGMHLSLVHNSIQISFSVCFGSIQNLDFCFLRISHSN